MFKVRFFSAVVLVLLTALAVFGGEMLFAGFIMAISLIGMMEFYKIYKIHNSFLGIVGYCIAIMYDILIYLGNTESANIVLISGLILLMSVYVFCFPKYDANQIMASYVGFVYVAVMLSFAFRIRAMQDGVILIWLVYICTWVNDTCAYLVGVMIGKHKMTPKLSPKKSYEGAIGGIAGTAIVGALYGYIFRGMLVAFVNPVFVCSIACGLGAFISIFGDLAASAIKRNHDIKDYGNLIPGHGGILDRFDSMIFVAPVVYVVIDFLAVMV